ncbi:MAG: hypothetical protein IKS16_01685 [Lachnospiraceae bacterium]|nr:hypothetical protein [Lachnospiraceae bacterium]
MGTTVVFDGELELLVCEDGEFGDYIAIHDGGHYFPYEGPYEVEPDWSQQILETEGLYMRDDVTVEAIEVARTSNPSGGITVYIGGTNG